MGALGNEGFLGPTFPAVVPNMQEPALSPQLCRSDPGNPENVALAEICRLLSAELSDVVFAMFPKALDRELSNVQNPIVTGMLELLTDVVS